MYTNYKKGFQNKKTDWSKYGNTSLKKQVVDLEKMVKAIQLKAPAMKFVDTLDTPAVISTGYVQSLNLLTAGTGELNNRVGNKIRIKSFQIRFNIAPPAGQALPDTIFIRIIIFLDRATNSTKIPLTGGAAIMEVPSSATVSPINTTYRERILVLMDKMLAFGSNNAVVGTAPYSGPNVFQFKKFRKFKEPIEVTYISNVGSYADIADNGLNICMYTNQTTVATSPTINYYCRAKFSDT